MKKPTLENIKAEIRRIDPELNEKEEPKTYAAEVVLLASAAIGPNIKKLSKFTGYSRQLISEFSKRLRKNKIWIGSRVYGDWIDKEDEAVAFFADCCVALGWLKRSSRENQVNEMGRIVISMIILIFISLPVRAACTGSSPSWTCSSWSELKSCVEGSHSACSGFQDGDRINVDSDLTASSTSIWTVATIRSDVDSMKEQNMHLCDVNGVLKEIYYKGSMECMKLTA